MLGLWHLLSLSSNKEYLCWCSVVEFGITGAWHCNIWATGDWFSQKHNDLERNASVFCSMRLRRERIEVKE